ncbi:MAG: SusC/RagA family TonB-linked outer membrane protein [Porphyromonas sp.]|nr:SusC/RagA family TonB-linked outer membrane protein [Porphyromonas sp.]
MKRLIAIAALLLATLSVSAQELRTITGRITEASTGEPLIGASVFIAPSQTQAKDYNPQGVVTDIDGDFKFTLPASVKEVVVSYIGFKEQIITLTPGKNVYDVALDEDTQTLGEVVVTGYQKIEKRKLTSSITTIDADEIKQVGVPSVDQMLLGQAAGVVVTPMSGAPGAQAQVRIRGTVSLSGSSEPLWVLDGIPLDGDAVPTDIGSQDVLDQLHNSSIAGLNPADIADITILKDAAATAIYGARAANGVIVITSKRGKEGKMRINFSADGFFTSRPDGSRLNLLNSDEKVNLELSLLQNPLHSYRSNHGDVARIIEGAGLTDAFMADGLSALTPEVQTQINALRGKSTDWFREIYEPTFNQQYGLSLSGGSEKFHYYTSFGYYDERGTTKGTSFKRYNLTANTDYQISDKVNVGLSLFANQNDRATYLAESQFSNPQRYTRNVNPYRELYDEKGNYIYDPDVTRDDDLQIPFNYVEELNNTNYTLKNQSLKAVADLEWKILQPLRFTSQLGLQIENNATEKSGTKDSFYVRDYRASSMYKGQSYLPEGGIIQNWNENFFQYNWKNQLFYSQRFLEKHDLDLMAGTELRRNTTTGIHTKGFGYDERTLTNKPIDFPEGLTASTINSSKYQPYRKQIFENAFVSFFSTLSYTYDNRYTLFASLRYDGSNLFGVDPKYKYLPLWSFSGSWNVNREEWMRDAEWLSNLKVRASYGIQGNVDKNTSPFVKGEWGTAQFFDGIYEDIITVLAPPNQKLRWEKTTTSNFGIDLGLLENRISLIFDYYYRNSDDLISVRSLPRENGFDFVNLNWGQVENRGWEIALSTTNIKTKDWTWTTSLNLSQNKSKVLEYNVRDNDYTPSLEGYPVNALFVIPTAGLDENGIMTFRGKDGKTYNFQEYYKLSTGAFGDVRSDLIPEDYRNLFEYAGDRDPKLTGGFSTTLRYKSVDLALYSNFFIDRWVTRTPFYRPTHVDPGVNFTRDIFDVWSPDNTAGIYPKILGTGTTTEMEQYAREWIGSYDPANTFSQYDIWAKKMSYWRISSIRLGYNLKGKDVDTDIFDSIRFSAEVRNPFVISTDYTGYFDPETYGNIYSQPVARTFSFGVNVTF